MSIKYIVAIDVHIARSIRFFFCIEKRFADQDFADGREFLASFSEVTSEVLQLRRGEGLSTENCACMLYMHLYSRGVCSCMLE